MPTSVSSWSIAVAADVLRQDVRYAVRGLRSHPLFACTVILTVGLGIGANATMFGVIDRLLFRAPDHVREPERVFQIETHELGSQFSQSSFSYAAYTDFRDHPGGFQSVAATWKAEFPVGHGPSAASVAGALASASFFPTLGARPALGRFFSADEDNPDNPQTVAVIGYGFWQRQFGGRADVIGRPLEIGRRQYTIIGVAPKGFTGIELTDTDVWLPIAAPSGLRFDDSPTWTKNRGNQWLQLVARLASGVSVAQATEQATAADRAGLRQRIGEEPKAARYIRPDSESVVLASLIPGKVPPGVGGRVAARDIKVSKLLGIVSLIVLVIACANVANLLLVRAFSRRREIAVRLALGVSRGRLTSQLLVEGLLLSTLGGIGALVVAHWASRSVRTLLVGAGAWTTEAVDGRLLLFTAVATLATGLATSLAPAIRAGRTDVGQVLKQGIREGGAQRSSLRSALLVVQAALAILLLSGAGLFIRSVENVNALPFGVDVDRVLVADVAHKSAGLTNEDARRIYEDFVTQARRVPGVASAAITIGLPFGLSWGADLHVPGRVLPTVHQGPSQYAVTPDYYKTMGIPLVAGRVFTGADRAGTAPVAIINRTMAQLYWPNQNPVGQCVKIGSDTMPCTTIVGVVANTVRQNLKEGIVAQIYRPLDQLPASVTDHVVSFFGYELVMRTRGNPRGLTEPVRRGLQAIGPAVPYVRVRPMRDLLGNRMRAWDLGAKVFSAFGVLALVLAAVGLYSVLAFSIAQRLHEFGVRMALGAKSTDLARLTLGVGLAPVIAGIAAGVVLALAGGRFVSSLLFDVSAHDPAVLAQVCALLLVTGAAASLLPAVRATRVDPAEVLRAE